MRLVSSRPLIGLIVITFALSFADAIAVNPNIAGPHYNATVVRHSPLKPNQKHAIITEVIPRLKPLQLIVVSAGKKRRVPPTKPALSRLSLAQLGGIRMALHTGKPGAEMDLMVRTEGQKPTPVEIRWQPNGTFIVESGRPTLFPPKPNVTMPLRFTQGSKRWSPIEQAHVREAFKRLSIAELALVRDLPLRRERTEQSGGWAKGGLYEQKGCFARIRMYAHAFSGRHLRFTGSPSQPLPKTIATILHEVGHALHHAPARRIYCELEARTKAFEKTRIQYNQVIRGTRKAQSHATTLKMQKWLKSERDQLEKLLQTAETLSRKGPVLMAFEKVRKGRSGPTLYGASSLAESFAEAFALFHSDRSALHRIWPNVTEWFAQGGHLKAK